jgi:hypothetical protein
MHMANVVDLLREYLLCRYLGGAFDVETLVENLLAQMAGSQIIAVNVYDITNESMPLVMYGHTHVEKALNTYVSELDFGDPLRKHEMRCRFKISSNLPFHRCILIPGSILQIFSASVAVPWTSTKSQPGNRYSFLGFN